MKVINPQPIESTVVKNHNGVKMELENSQVRGDGLLTIPQQSSERDVDFFRTHYIGEQEPFFKPSDKVLWTGHCSAQESATFFDSYTRENVVLRIGHGVNSFASYLVLFDWLFNDWEVAPVWPGYTPDDFYMGRKHKAQILRNLAGVTKVVLSVGVTQVAVDKKTGMDLPWPVPKEFYVKGRHGFRTVSMVEHDKNVDYVIHMIHKHICHDIMFMITPHGVFQNPQGMAKTPENENHVEKAMLRLVPENHDEIVYFPWYDILQDLFYGFRDKNGIHLHSGLSHGMLLMLAGYYGDFGIKEEEIHRVVTGQRKKLVEELYKRHKVLKGTEDG